MSSVDAIIEKLRAVAEGPPSNMNMWKTDEDWADLINNKHPGSKLTFKDLKAGMIIYKDDKLMYDGDGEW